MFRTTMIAAGAGALALAASAAAAPVVEAEWAGAFALAPDTTHQWSMQAIDGEYADPSMRLAILPTEDPSEMGMEALEEDGAALLSDEDCAVIEAGETIAVPAAGGCFELHVGETEDSTYPLETPGMAGIVVIAQHMPIEFERDMHYLKDAEGTDIEPVAQEGGESVIVKYTCNPDGTIRVQENCDSETCDGECEYDLTVPDLGCFIAEGSVHIASCTDGIATVNIYNDHESCEDELAGEETEDHTHVSGECEVSVHFHNHGEEGGHDDHDDHGDHDDHDDHDDEDPTE